MNSHQQKSLTSEIPYLYYSDQIVQNSDGTLFAGIQISGKDTISLTLEDLQNFKSRIFPVLEKVPPGYIIQFFHHYHDDLHKELESSPLFDLQSETPFEKQYKDQLKRDLLGSGISKKVELYCFIIKPGSKGPNKNLKRKILNLLAAKRSNRSDEEGEYAISSLSAEASNLKNLVNGLVLSFKESLGLEAKILDEQAFSSLAYQILNPGKGMAVSRPDLAIRHDNMAFDLETIREKVVQSHIQEFSGHLKINKTFYKILTFRLPPSATSPADSDAFLNTLSFPCVWSFNIHRANNESVNNRLSMRQKRKFALTANERNPNYEAVHSRSEIEAALMDQKEQGFSWCNLSMTFVIWDTDLNILSQKCEIMRDRFASLQDLEICEATFNQFQTFKRSLPGGSRDDLESHLVTSFNVNDLVPISVPSPGTEDIVTHFHTYRDTLFQFSTFSDEFNNWNQIVIGQTGSGKSFIVNALLAKSLVSTKSPQVMILDLGKSFKKLTEFWGGDYITIDLDDPDLGLNPIPLRDSVFENENLSSFGLLDFTVQLIIMMCGLSQNKELQPRIVRECLLNSYETVQGRTPILSDLQKSLLQYADKSKDIEDASIARKLGKLLDEYTVGVYSKIFNRESKFSHKSNFFCFDFKQANSNEKIREIITYIIGGYFTRKMTENSEHKYIIIDEFSTTMQHETGAMFCKMVAKNCRKHGVSFICISQEIEDFLSNPAARAVYNQSNFKWFLKMNDSLEKHSEYLRLSSRDVQIIQGLHTKKGQYSQVYLNYANNKTLLYLRPDPLTYWICTNDPKDNKMAQLYQEAGYTLQETVCLLAQKYPSGVKNSDLLQVNITKENLCEN